MEYLWQYQLYLVMAPVMVVLTVYCCLKTFRQRKTVKTAVPLIWYQMCSAGFVAMNSLEQLAVSREGTVFYAKISYLFLTMIPATWFLFAINFVRNPMRRIKAVISALLIIPVTTTILTFTNERHHLIWDRIDFISMGNLLAMRVSYGRWFYIHVLFAYFFILAGAVIILIGYSQAQLVFRTHRRLVVAAVFLPLAINTIYILRLVPGFMKDFTGIALCVSGLLFYLGMIQFRILDLLPLARTVVFEQMPDGIIVLDSTERIIDINPAALNLLGGDPDILGGDANEKLSGLWPELGHSLRTREHSYRVCMPLRGAERKFNIIIQPLFIKDNFSGWLITLKEITRETKLLEKVEKLACTDGLTGVLNRRAFMEAAGEYEKQSAEDRQSSAMIFFDIDHFKETNDGYGHSAGDLILVQVCRRVESCLRATDILGRLGGEEFVVFMPGAGSSEAGAVAERLRNAVCSDAFWISESGIDKEITTTISLGVCAMGAGFVCIEKMLRKADEALYAAKAEGRNRTVLKNLS